MKLAHIFLILTFASIVSGQSVEEKIKTFEKPKHYRVNYDKFKDSTLILSPNYPAKNDKGSIVAGVSLYAFFPTKNVNLDMRFMLEFNSTNQPIRSRDVILLVDGDRVTLEDGIPANDVRVSSGVLAGLAGESGRVTTESRMTFNLTNETLEKLSKSKVIEFQIDAIEGVFSEDTIRTLREMLKLYPTPGRTPLQ